MTQRILRNRAQCRKCGDIVESRFRHDYVACDCGAIAVDGGLDYLRRGFQDYGDLLELAEFASDAEGDKEDA